MVVASILLAVALWSGMASAQTLSLRAPSIANVDGVFTARFGVAVEELVVLKGELEDGAKLVLTCQVSLTEANDYLPDNELASAEFVSRIEFEQLTKHFVMTLPDRTAPLRGTDLRTLVREGWEHIETPLGSWNMLERGTAYRLTLKTAINEADAPEGIAGLLYFWTWGTGEDSTFQLNFTY